jgi:hypothetical protein
MRIRISEHSARFDFGMGLTLLCSTGAMILPLFIVIDAISGKLTWVLPTLILACAFGAALGGVLTSRPFTVAATFTGSLFFGAAVLIVVFVFAIADAGATAETNVASRVIAIACVGGVLLLVTSLRLKRFAKRRGEAV